MIKYSAKFFFLLAFVVTGCQTSTPINSGIQPGFEAVNPAAIISVPIFIIPDPSFETSTIDPSLIITEKLIPSLENKIMESFNHQPNINGYSFSAVKKALKNNNMSVEKPALVEKSSTEKVKKTPEVLGIESKVVLNVNVKNDIWGGLNQTIREVADRFSSRDTGVRLLITPNCLARKNFVEFYTYCLADEPVWLAELNLLSARVLNADSALITVITQLQNKNINKQYQINGGLAVLLVDTNNGKLIWGNYKIETLTNPVEKQYYPSWDELLNKILAPDFWNNFPGRIGKNQLTIDTSEVK